MQISFCEHWARKVLVSGESQVGTSKFTYPFLDRSGISSEDNTYVHLVVVGMTDMGIALAIEAAHIAHYSNFISKGKKTRITFIDKNARYEMNRLLERYPSVFKLSHYTFLEYVETGLADDKLFSIADEKYTDIEWNFIQSDIDNHLIQKTLEFWSRDIGQSLTVAVCLTDTSQNSAIGLHLSNQLYQKQVPIFVYQHSLDDFFKKSVSGFQNVKPFGMCDDSSNPEPTFIEMAQKVNYIYNYYYDSQCDYEQCDLSSLKFDRKSLDTLWHQLTPDKQCLSLRNALAIPTKLRSVGIDYLNPQTYRDLTEDEVSLLSEVEHNRWNTAQLFLNYRPVTADEFAEIKNDITKKTWYQRERRAHYDIRAYSDLQIDHSGFNVNRYDKILTKALMLIVDNANVID